MLYINMFDFYIIFNILDKDNISFIVIIKDTSANRICNS